MYVALVALLATEMELSVETMLDSSCSYRLVLFVASLIQNGERAQGKKDLLQGKEVHQAHSPQGDPVQGR